MHAMAIFSQSGLASCRLISQSTVIHILSILTGQAKSLWTHMLIRTVCSHFH